MSVKKEIIRQSEIVFQPQEAKIVNDMVGMNNDLIAINKQREQHELAIKEIEKVVHDVKSGKIKEASQIYGGSLIIPQKDMKEFRKILMGRRKTFGEALISINNQIQVREDLYVEMVMKVYTILNRKLKAHGLTDEQLKPYESDEIKYEIPSSVTGKR